jgi:hypothetical protein
MSSITDVKKCPICGAQGVFDLNCHTSEEDFRCGLPVTFDGVGTPGCGFFYSTTLVTDGDKHLWRETNLSPMASEGKVLRPAKKPPVDHSEKLFERAQSYDQYTDPQVGMSPSEAKSRKTGEQAMSNESRDMEFGDPELMRLAEGRSQGGYVPIGKSQASNREKYRLAGQQIQIGKEPTKSARTATGRAAPGQVGEEKKHGIITEL